MIKIEVLVFSLKKIIIITNDLSLPNMVQRIYPYIKVIDINVCDDENIVLIENNQNLYNVKYKDFEYNDLTNNSLYYFLYEIIQIIIEEQMISNSVSVFHGSCVERKGKAYVFAAKTNTGKSTLVAELIRKNYNYVSDDYAILDETGHRIVPLHLPIKLRSLIPLGGNIADWIIVRDYNPVRDENYYLIRPQLYSLQSPFEFQAFFQINRSENINRITSLDYKESYKTLILNSKIPEKESVRRMNSLAISLVKSVKVYNIDYVSTADCIEMFESVTKKMN